MPPNHPGAQFYRDIFKKSGRPSPKAPQWTHTRAQLSESAFTPYDSTTVDSFRGDVDTALRALEAMKHPKADCPIYLGSTPGLPDYSEVTKAVIPEHPTPLSSVIEDMVELLDGLPNAAHPLHQPNVLPNSNKASIIAGLLANYTSQNAIEGEYAWNLCKAEMETAAMITDLIKGWSTAAAGGMFTYGGSGCYLYAIKYALAHVLESQNSRCVGVRVDGKIFCSQQGHYAKMNSTDWLGLGMNNYVDIDTDDDTNSMDLEHLETEFQIAQDQGKPVIAVVCTMGTTDAFAIDPVKGVRALVEKYPNPEGFAQTIIYCDAVIGWSFLPFKDYSIVENKLGFSATILEKIEKTYKAISEIEYADAVGVDFHKTGWAPYATSMFLTKDLQHYKALMSRPGSVYLQNRTPYNPGLYTLEVSRSAAPALSAWATLKYFGKLGMQSVVGGVLEMSQCLRALIEEEDSMVCVNETDYGFVTLLRVYPEGVNAVEQYEKELTDDSYVTKKELQRHNKYQEDIASQIWWWFRTGVKIDGLYGPYTNFTSGFRTTDYNDDMGDESGVIYALKSFPMNVSVNTQTMQDLINVFKIGRTRVDTKQPCNLPEEPIGAPYDLPITTPECGDGEDANAYKITSLLSGVAGARTAKIKRGQRGGNVGGRSGKKTGGKKNGCDCDCECDE